MKYFVYLLLLFILLPFNAYGLTKLYASPSGAGSQNGLSPANAATISGVKVIARSYNSSDDVIIYLAGGYYDLSGGGLTFSTLDSGRAGGYVLWRNMPGEIPLLSGGYKIENWTQVDVAKNIWRASIPAGAKARVFFVNGRMSRRAHWVPDGYSYLPLTRTSVNPLTFNLTVGLNFPDPTTMKAPDDLELYWEGNMGLGGVPDFMVYYYGMRNWNNASTTGVSKTGSTVTFVTNRTNSYPYDLWMYAAKSNATWVENAYEFLNADTKGYHVKPSTENYIYYVPLDGEDMSTAECFYPHQEQVISGTSGLDNIFFMGLSIKHTRYKESIDAGYYVVYQGGQFEDPALLALGNDQHTYSDGPGYVEHETYADEGLYFQPKCVESSVDWTYFPQYTSQTSCETAGKYWEDDPRVDIPPWIWNTWGTKTAVGDQAVITPAVRLEDVDNVKFWGNEIADVGGEAVWLHRGVSDADIVGNIISNVAATGIRVGSSYIRDFDDGLTNPYRNYSYTVKRTENIQILSNKIDDTAKVYKDTSPIFAPVFDNLDIKYNKITNAPSTAISLGLFWTLTDEYWWDKYEPVNWWYGAHLKSYVGDAEVAYNEIGNVAVDMADVGAVYTMANLPSTTIHSNYIHSSGNDSASAFERVAIYFDEGSKYEDAYNNVIDNSNGELTGFYAMNYGSATGDLHIRNNYYTSGLSSTYYYLFNNDLNWHQCVPGCAGGSQSGNTAISLIEAAWPAEAKAIKEAAAVQTYHVSPVYNGRAFIFGWKEGVNPPNISGAGYVVEDVSSLTDGRWSAMISNVNDNLGSLTVGLGSAQTFTPSGTAGGIYLTPAGLHGGTIIPWWN